MAGKDFTRTDQDQVRRRNILGRLDQIEQKLAKGLSEALSLSNLELAKRLKEQDKEIGQLILDNEKFRDQSNASIAEIGAEVADAHTRITKLELDLRIWRKRELILLGILIAGTILGLIF